MGGCKKCINCTERRVEPNCHLTCEEYLESKRQAELTKAKAQLDSNYYAYVKSKNPGKGSGKVSKTGAWIK